MGERFFAYGSLQVPEVMRAVTGRCFETARAVAPGFVRFRLRGRPYPGLVRLAGGVTDGLLYQGLDTRLLELLDLFEGDLYQRRRIEVVVAGRQRLGAFAYLLREKYQGLLSDQPWDLERFRRNDLKRFLAAIQEGCPPAAGGLGVDNADGRP